jgi:hypothetical protein
LLCGLSVLLFSQQASKPKITIAGTPSEPIAVGTCTSSTFGYVELNGRRNGFTDAEFGNAMIAALHQGYVITVYPPTKSGIFVNQECNGSLNRLSGL